MSDLRSCCQQALLDGFTPDEHFPHCRARAEEPPKPTPEEGGLPS